MLYPPLFSSFVNWKFSVLSPKGFNMLFPNPFNLPIISAISLFFVSSSFGGSSLSADCTVFWSMPVKELEQGGLDSIW
jgi:hypothetical protein